MNSLPKSLESLRDAVSAMPAASRLIAGMLIAVIAIGLGLLVKGNSGGEFEHLFGGRSLSESEVDSVEMAFSQAGLRDWIRDGRRIRVPSGTRSEYLAALRESSTLPLALRSSVQEAIDQASLLESSDQRLARIEHAKAQDLGAKISAFPEIRWASVEYDRGERTGLSRSRTQSASVIVSPEGAEPLTKDRIKMIKEFVRGAYAGMTSEEVVVTDTNASFVSGQREDEDPMLRKRREEETAYEQKILRALVGYGPIRVAAHAELDPTMGVETATLKYEPPPATLQRFPKKVDFALASPRRQDAAAVAANTLGNRAASLEESSPAVETHAERPDNHGLIGQQYELSKLASLQVRRVRISVGLPTSYYDKVLVQDYLREHPDKTAAEMPPPTTEMLQQKRSETENKIKAAVAQLLPLAPPGEDPYPLVHVWDYPDLPQPAVAAPGAPSPVLTWLSQSWSTLAMLGLALVAILVARSALRGNRATGRGDADADTTNLHSNSKAFATGAARDAAESADASGNAGSLREELQRMVETHPEVAANVLRAWVSEAA